MWDKTVRKYRIGHSTGIIGFCYFDLINRSGKASFGGTVVIRPGLIGCQPPEMVIVMDLEHDQFFSHTELVAILSYVGQALYYLSRRGMFAISERDNENAFIPAHIFSFMAWEDNFLSYVSSHYQTGIALPAETRHKIINSRNIAIGVHTKKKIFFSIFDQLLHGSPEFIPLLDKMLTKGKAEITDFVIRMYQQLFQQVMSCEDKKIIPNQGVLFPTSWFNVFDGDSGLCFVQLLSDIIATNIYVSIVKPLIEKGENLESLYDKIMIRRMNPQQILEHPVSIDNYLSHRGLLTDTEDQSFFFKEQLPEVYDNDVVDSLSMSNIPDENKYADELITNHFTEISDTEGSYLELSEPVSYWTENLESIKKQRDIFVTNQ